MEVSPRRQTEMMLLAEGLLDALPERMPKKPPAPSQRREQNRADRMARYEECRRLKQLGLSNHEIARRTGMCRETVRKFVCAETFPERVSLSATQSDDGALCRVSEEAIAGRLS